VFRLAIEVVAWVWRNGEIIGSLATAIAVWFAYRAVRLQQTPIIIVNKPAVSGVLGDDHSVRSLQNSGQGPAFNVCVHQQGQLETLEFSWLGSLAPGDTGELHRPVRIEGVEDNPHVIWYQDAARRWYSTRLAVQGYGLASIFEGQRVRFVVPATVRENARAETVVQTYNRLVWLNRLRRWRKRN
jgi:hypothetical protein